MEEWKDLKDYEGIYQISNKGQIRTLEREEKTNNRWGSMVRKRNGFILKQSVNHIGHLCIQLNKDGKFKRQQMHVLVFETFVGERKKGKCIHHIDYNKQNNCVENLVELSYTEHNNIHKHPSWNKGRSWTKEEIDKRQNSRKKYFLTLFKEAYDIYESTKDIFKVVEVQNVCKDTAYRRVKQYRRTLIEH